MNLYVANKKYVQLTAAISLAVSFLIHFPELVSLSGIQEQRTLFPDMSLTDVLFEVGYAFLSLQAIFAINTAVFRFNCVDTRITWWKVILSFVLAWLASRMFGEAFVYLHRHFNVPAIDATVHHYLHPIRDFMMGIVVTGTCYIYYLTNQRQAVLLQNGELLAENVRNQYQALKNQMNPHMLFNSLNTLQSLVRENPERAQDYICQLSRVLRYTLKEEDSHAVTLREEMEFVEAYIFLMKMRYEDNLNFTVNVDSRCPEYVLPPLSVQTLVENAVKHNEISNRKPLAIEIKTERADDAFVLIVENTLQPRRTVYSGTGIGLANLAKRYKLLFGKEISITEIDGRFRVCIPLVKP
ncbi:sensor histidine kinase [Phocaeicola vulgatus]|uniref:sensor histidine kinase n=1 Tax=Phocaeicola vulgatus TaxID=821 RepID=UPI003DA4F966